MMSACNCPERNEPVARMHANRPGRLWRVIQRECNCSAFNGYAWRHSVYSALVCLRCGASWRTKAAYVVITEDIGHLDDNERNIAPGIEGYAQKMEAWGRRDLRIDGE